MIRSFSFALALAALACPATAQTRYSVGVVASHERAAGPGPLTGLGVTVNARRGFALVQATLANIAVGPVTDYSVGPGGSDVETYRVNVSVGADVSGVLPVAGPLAATVGVGLGVTRLDQRYIDVLVGRSVGWDVERYVSVGALVGRAEHMQGYARLLVRSYSDGLNPGRAQVGVLVPFR